MPNRERVTSRVPASATYSPRFFSKHEWRTLYAAVDRLIPPDAHGPSASEAGVPEYIDRQLELPFGHGAWFYMQGPHHPEVEPAFGYQHPQTPRELYRLGLAGMDAAAGQSVGKLFMDLGVSDQDRVLSMAETGDKSFADWPARPFFNQLLQNTREGYFGDPTHGGNRGLAAWRMIGFPGARADYADWIDRPGAVYPHGPVALDGTTT